MNLDKLKFDKLDKKERKILLTALDLNPLKLKCRYCKKRIGYKKCGIMPSSILSVNAVITCESPLCIAEYIDEYQDFKTKKK